MRILLHSCCGPCSTAVVEELKKSDWDISACYFNLNIHPYTEYKLRLKTLREFLQIQGIPLLAVSEYDLKGFIRKAGMDNPGRCTACYRMRMEAAAELAAKEGFTAYTTTLLISPWQDHEQLRAICEDCGKQFGVEFFYQDFRTVYKKSVELSKSMDMYRQKYCGCIFSEEERYTAKNKNR